jgi:hypothetical protein
MGFNTTNQVTESGPKLAGFKKIVENQQVERVGQQKHHLRTQ